MREWGRGGRPSRPWHRGGGGVLTKTTQWWIQTFRWGSWGGDHPGPDIEGGASSQKHFSTLRASFWSKNMGGGVGGGPLPWIRHCNLVHRPLFLENWRSDPTSGLPFSKGKTMAKRLGMMPGCIKCYFLCLFPEPGSNWSTEKPRIHDYLKTDFI